ncbi:hypothetical protein K439DRAFT_1610567 [Ramaria rubella]|nr:hypothetical protein K439DRAFT_1610567 [Ramaria rubella]
MCGLSLTGNVVAFRVYHEKFHGNELWCLVVPRGQRSQRSCVSRRQHPRVTSAPLASDINGAGACVLAVVDDEHHKHLVNIQHRIERDMSCSSSVTTSTSQMFIFPPRYVTGSPGVPHFHTGAHRRVNVHHGRHGHPHHASTCRHCHQQ